MFLIENRKNVIWSGFSWFTLTGGALSFILDFVQKNNIIKILKIQLVQNIKWENKKNSSNILLLKDYEKIIESKKIIARKFDEKEVKK